MARLPQELRALPPGPSRQSSSPRWLAWTAFASVSVFWGTTAPAIRYAVGYFPPLELAGLRFAIASFVILSALALLRRLPQSLGRACRSVVPGAAALALSNALVTFGFQRVQSGPGALLLATTAMNIALWDALWPGSPRLPSPSLGLGLLLGLLGVVVLLGDRAGGGHSDVLGYALLLASSMSWGLGSVWQARRPSGLDAITTSGLQMAMASAALLLTSLLSGETFAWPHTLGPWAAMGFLVVTGSLIAFVAYHYILAHLSTALVGLYTYLNPLAATLAGAACLGERVGPRFFAAASLILGAVALVQLSERRRRAAVSSNG